LVKKRFGRPFRFSIFRFLPLPMSGAVVPSTIASTTNAISSGKGPADESPEVQAQARLHPLGGRSLGTR